MPASANIIIAHSGPTKGMKLNENAIVPHKTGAGMPQK